MKKPILMALISCACFTTTAFAQQKGNVEATGNIGFGVENTENTPGDNESGQTNFNIGLQGGYLLTDKFSIGGLVGYDYLRSTNDNGNNSNESTTSLFNVGVYARYYVTLPVERIKLDFTGAAQFGFGTVTNETTNPAGTNEDEYGINQFQVGVYPGLVVGLTDRLALTANYGALAFTSETVEDNNSDFESTTNGFGLNADLTTLRMGVRLFF